VKKGFCLFAHALLLIFLISLPSYAGTIYIAPSPTTVLAGQTFTLGVNVTGITDLYAFQFDLAFNPAVISATGISEGPFLPGGGTTFFIPGSIDNVTGAITSTADVVIGAVLGVSGNGTLAWIDFQALAVGTSSLDLSNLLFLDSTGSDITVTSQSGSVVVGTAVPEPSTILLLVGGLIGLAALARGRH